MENAIKHQTEYNAYLFVKVAKNIINGNSIFSDLQSYFNTEWGSFVRNIRDKKKEKCI